MVFLLKEYTVSTINGPCTTFRMMNVEFQQLVKSFSVWFQDFDRSQNAISSVINENIHFFNIRCHSFIYTWMRPTRIRIVTYVFTAVIYFNTIVRTKSLGNANKKGRINFWINIFEDLQRIIFVAMMLWCTTIKVLDLS